MKNISKKILILLVVASMCFVTGCKNKKGEENNPPVVEPKPAQELKLIADFLYEVYWNGEFDWNESGLAPMANAGCSAVQNGNYRGRNYDWYYDDTYLCVVHSDVTDNRKHASVGVADLSFITDKDGNIDIPKIPFKVIDGINDAGVCIQVNVMPTGETGNIPHTETTEDDLFGGSVVRFVLDNADNVSQILEELKKKDIESVFAGEELHWMISGPTSSSDPAIKTVVVEVFSDGLHITEDFIDNKPIMTNFNVSNFNGTPASVGMGMGYERWQILCENYDQADSIMGTFDLMEKVYYSKFYDMYSDRLWYSEYALTNLCNYYTEAELVEMLSQEVYDYYMNTFGGVYYNPALWDGQKAINGDPSKAGCLSKVVPIAVKHYLDQEKGYVTWITIHTSVYDLASKTLDIQVRESQDHLHFTIK